MTAPAQRVRVVRTREELVALEQAWSALAVRAGAPIALTPEWAVPWFEAFGEGAEPRAVVVEDLDGALRGLLPLAIRRVRVGGIAVRVLEFAGDAVACGDHFAVLAASGDFEAVWSELAPLVPACAAEADLVRLGSLDPGESERRLSALAARAAWRPAPARDDVAPRLALAGGWEAIERQLSAKFRQQLRRNARHFAAAHPAQTIVVNDERTPLDEAMTNLERLHASLWRTHGTNGAFADPILRAWTRRFVARSAERGWLRLYQLFAGPAPVAALLACHREGVAYYYQSGWDPRYAEWSVGEMLVAHSIREAAREGLHTYDFLRGSEGYKTRYPTEVRPLLTRAWTVSARGRVAVASARVQAGVSRAAVRWRGRVFRVLRKVAQRGAN